jgi:hypothetical protein
LTTAQSQSVSLASGATEHVTFGFQPPGTIQGHVFRDDDGDGTQDASEPGLSQIYVNVVGGSDGTTDASGEVSFSEIPGDYTVEVDDNDNDLPPDSVLTTDQSQSVSLASGATEHVYFGFQPRGTIQGHVFRDDNGNGTQDAGEPGLSQIYVNVVGGWDGTTDASGEVSFSERPGDYTVEVDDNDGDLPAGSVLTTAQSQSVSLASGATEHIYFGFQPQGTIQEIVYLDENRNGTYDAGTDGLLPNVSVDVNCQYGYGGTVETDANGQYSLSGMPAGTCNVSVDEADADIPDGSTLVEGNNPASVTLSGGGTAGERYGFEPPDIWQGGTPSGEVFVHTYVPDLSIEEADYLADDLIHLDIQRWSGLAPIFRADNLPELCLTGTSTCETGDVRTVRFVVEDTDGDGQAIENLTGKQPTFDYPNGQEVVYTHDHAWGDTNYDDCEYLWVLLLSKGGVTPDDGLASPTGCVQAIAETGYPGTYQVEGTLYLRAQWTGGISYEHDWDIPIEFYVTQRAPYPQSP